MEARTIHFAIRDTRNGFTPTQVETRETNFGGRRRFSTDTSLKYKREAFARQKAINFYTRLYGNWSPKPNLVFVGTIGPNDYKGERA